MNVLLDTHVLIWALENNPALSADAKENIIRPENLVFVSAVSVWEIAIKKRLGRLTVPDNLQEEIQIHRFTPLAVNYDHAELAGELPPIHKDPFDRMLIAQAVTEKLTLITRDEQIRRYDVATITA
jgi:PIN domain nuclease of toxin-antitoxin system